MFDSIEIPIKINKKSSNNQLFHQISCDLLHQNILEEELVLCDKPAEKISIPLKQYSNKFLRDAKKQENKLAENSMLNYFLEVQKKKKMNNYALSKKNNRKKSFIIKTQPSQQKEHRITFGSFVHKRKTSKRVKTECLTNQESNPTAKNQRIKTLQQQINPEGFIKAHKISTSRGLQFFSKLFVKQKVDNLDKIKINNPVSLKENSNKKVLSEKFNQNQRNLEAKKMTLQRKDRQIVKTENQNNPEAKKINYAIKNRKNISFRNRKSELLDRKEEEFDINGWQTFL